MQLTPGQIREVLGLSLDAYRHWRTTLSPLSTHNGHRPCFSHGDLFAMALIQSLTEDAGIRIGALHAVAATLFQQCNAQPWAAFERAVLVLELPNVRVNFLPDTRSLRFSKIGIVVACSPIIADLRDRLLMSKEEPDQGNLKLAPTIVSATTAGRRAS
jgi:hypothetical protein